MRKHHLLSILTIVLFLFVISVETRAQYDWRKTEAGFVITGLDVNDAVGEKPIGIGGRLGYNFNEYVAIDGQLNYFPENPQGNFGQTQGLLGVRAGVRVNKRIGVFAKVRPGFVRFGGDFFKVRNGGARNYFDLDVGGVLEFYPNSRVIVRVDYGDNIIMFGDDQINRATVAPVTPGTTHNLQASFGIGFRF